MNFAALREYTLKRRPRKYAIISRSASLSAPQLLHIQDSSKTSSVYACRPNFVAWCTPRAVVGRRSAAHVSRDALYTPLRQRTRRPYAVRYSSAAPFLPRSFCLYRYRFSFSPSVFLLFFPFLLLLFFCLCIICPLLGAPRLFRSVYRCRTQGFFPLPAAGFVRRSIWPIITCPLPR